MWAEHISYMRSHYTLTLSYKSCSSAHATILQYYSLANLASLSFLAAAVLRSSLSQPLYSQLRTGCGPASSNQAQSSLSVRAASTRLPNQAKRTWPPRRTRVTRHVRSPGVSVSGQGRCFDRNTLRRRSQDDRTRPLGDNGNRNVTPSDYP